VNAIALGLRIPLALVLNECLSVFPAQILSPSFGTQDFGVHGY
jgi:hypothetical protein